MLVQMRMSLAYAVAAGAAVAVALYFLIALNTWTVIHSGWSESAIRTFFNVMWVAPLTGGAVAAVLTFRRLQRRR
jgi:hypothetical protein